LRLFISFETDEIIAYRYVLKIRLRYPERSRLIFIQIDDFNPQFRYA